MEYTYTILLLPEPIGEFMVEVPALPGCFSRGKTEAEATRNAEEAIQVHVAAMLKHGAEIPREGRATGKKVSDTISRVVGPLDIQTGFDARNSV